VIYLIETTYYDKETKEVLDLLKIGYTEDSKKDKRFMAYRMHNPGYKLLYEVLGYSEDIEKRIQYKFKDLLYSEYGREWFYYSEDIINFFKDIDSIDLESLPKNPIRGSKDFKKIKNECREVLSYFFNSKDTEDYLKNIISKVKDQLTRDYVIEYLRKDSRIGSKKVDRYFEVLRCRESGIYCEDDMVNQEVSEFLRIYISLNTMKDKLKLLCEYGLSSDAIDIVLGQIADSDEIKSYYTTLGPDRLRALSYSKTFIKKELNIVTFSQDLLEKSMYLEFKEGDKLSLVDIKTKLTNIYDSISYDRKAKATDLENYFEVKKCTINFPDKRVNGLEIIKKKE
jgi:uncharacterized protein YehS (DUF1456 family)